MCSTLVDRYIHLKPFEYQRDNDTFEIENQRFFPVAVDVPRDVFSKRIESHIQALRSSNECNEIAYILRSLFNYFVFRLSILVRNRAYSDSEKYQRMLTWHNRSNAAKKVCLIHEFESTELLNDPTIYFPFDEGG